MARSSFVVLARAERIARAATRLAATRLPLGAVLLLALALRLAALEAVGPQLGIDSSRYLEQANRVVTHGVAGLSGVPIQSSPLYTLLLAGALVTGGAAGTWVVCFVQALLGTVTVLVVAHLAERGTGSRSAGVAAAAVAAVQPTFVFWSSYVLSDTAFLLGVAVCFDRLYAIVVGDRPFRDGLVSALLLAIALFLRPTAAPLLLVAPLFILWSMHRRRSRLLAAMIGLLAPAAAVGLVSAVLGVAGFWLVGPDTRAHLGVYTWGAVYGGLEWTEQGRATNGVDITVPPDVPTLNSPELADWFERQSLTWIESDPGHFAAQLGRKARTFWAPVLPEWSTAHKLLTGGYFVAFYALAAIGAWRAWPVNRALVVLLTLGVAAFTATSVVTIVDYDLRYRLPAEVLLVPLVGVGLSGFPTGLAWLTRHSAIPQPSR